VTKNIGYGGFDATEPEMTTVAKIAEAHEFIIHLPQGYETIVGERGQKLSAEHRQQMKMPCDKRLSTRG
jgi:ATP-binding cassette subfamily B protein